MSTRPVGSLRQHVAHVNHGTAVMMLLVQSALDDLEGAATAHQWGLLLVQARQTVLACLHVRGLAHGATPYAYDDAGAFDPFRGAAEDEIEEAVALIDRARTVRADGVAQWLADLRRFAAESEATLGLPAPLPTLRSPEGMFGAMRLIRDWTPLLDQLELPPILPGDWTTRM